MHKSPTSRGRADARVGPNYQADVPVFVAPTSTDAAAVGAGASSSSTGQAAVDTSAAMWVPQSAKNINDELWKETRLSDYFRRANELVDRIKAEKLRRHRDSETKSTKRVQQRRSSGGGNVDSGSSSSAAASATVLQPARGSQRAQDTSMVFGREVIGITIHQALQDRYAARLP